MSKKDSSQSKKEGEGTRLGEEGREKDFFWGWMETTFGGRGCQLSKDLSGGKDGNFALADRARSRKTKRTRGVIVSLTKESRSRRTGQTLIKGQGLGAPFWVDTRMGTPLGVPSLYYLSTD